MAASLCISSIFHSHSACLSLPPISTSIKTQRATSSFPCLNFFRPNFGSNRKPLETTRLRISRGKGVVESNYLLRAPVISCLVEDSSEKETTLDLKLPRRSLLVTFTCNACGSRSQKFINRLAYERGTVFVQCSGCFQHHKLVDNLGLVVEYNLKEESDVDSNAEQD